MQQPVLPPPEPRPPAEDDRVVTLIAASFAVAAGLLGIVIGAWHFAVVFANYWDGATLGDQLTTIAVYGLTVGGGAGCIALALWLLRADSTVLTPATLAACAAFVVQGALIGTDFQQATTADTLRNLVALAATVAGLGTLGVALLVIRGRVAASDAAAAGPDPQTGARPAGWYPDPRYPAQLRWWDGSRWSAHIHSR